MQTRRHPSFALLFVMLSVMLAACGAGASTGSGSSGTSTALKNVSIGFGYIPDIQFSSFYVAQSKGYYQSFGLNVTFHHGFVNDVIVSMVKGNDTFVLATGDEELVARSKNLPVVDVATIYQRYPVSLIVPASSSICTLAHIKGHTIGYPGPFR